MDIEYERNNEAGYLLLAAKLDCIRESLGVLHQDLQVHNAYMRDIANLLDKLVTQSRALKSTELVFGKTVES